MKKQIYFIGILLLLSGNLFALKPKLASALAWWTQQHIDLNTGNDYLSVEHYKNFYNREKIKFVSITTQKINDAKNKIQMTFNKDGNLIREIIDYRERSQDEYKYDDKRQLTSVNNSIFYLHDGCRRSIVYKNSNGSQTMKICSINEFHNGYIVEENNPELFMTRNIIFEYDGNNLRKVVSKTENGQYRKSIYIEEVEWIYDEELLKFVEFKVGETKRIDVRIEITKYDNNGNIMQLKRITDYSKDKVYEYIYDFSDYDAYGNWHKYVCYCDGSFCETATRDIEYW